MKYCLVKCITNCDKGLLQIAPGKLLQIATSFMTNCDRYYKLRRYYKMRQYTPFATNAGQLQSLFRGGIENERERSLPPPPPSPPPSPNTFSVCLPVCLSLCLSRCLTIIIIVIVKIIKGLNCKTGDCCYF